MAIPAAGEKLVKMLSRVDELRPKYWEMEGTVDSVEDVPWVRFHREGFSALPEEVDPGCGVLLPTGRGARKREQINFLVNAAGAFLCKQVGGGILVDMCGGCGHVGLVLAALFPQWEVVIADMNPKALAVAAKRASDAGLSNVQTWEGRIDEFDQPFDFCIALHACGMASDIAIAKAIEARAPVVCAPCCVGKVTSALEVNEFTSSYLSRFLLRDRVDGALDDAAWLPRSRAFRANLNKEQYATLAKAADFGDQSPSAGVGSWRRAAKSFTEMDRIYWIAEHQYDCRLVKLEPLTSTPKNDVLIAWPKEQSSEVHLDFARAHGPMDLELYESQGPLGDFPSWLVEEISSKLRGLEGELTLDQYKGSRERKLVHVLAGQMGYKHRSTGTGARRTVTVSPVANDPDSS
uniref:R3H domain-containing protein n=1 Tax=Rhodosorus marinus TaxID=101924 RepID=A0A7S2ZQU7_9RHOD|mmetsp:Transcript_29061/g.112980  ORF Transcript_29061/g.112980 Transcript_29061/m.112980 type:complete len:406 (+) Transcript_29061:360-1577(+)|eukprot:CAMPEP_0113954422 /NCGR_PEP_ID=MMETSP0011_2-20120614/527_1 /TAXON_ID=101924 /ORGANISM="Rhodosorus marinus" /LENGTH=405 /DNA_ID=CAMNT_0000963515 /DNA_START=195 /DNA_END=1412 /DNA_ORIENTATION=- /assembly_acc=CAM_ASM_000156